MRTKNLSFVLCLLLLSFTLLLTACRGADPSEKIYNEAIKLLNDGKYEDAYNKFVSIQDKKDVRAYLDRFVWVCTLEKYTNHSGTFTRTTEYICNDYGYVVLEIETDSNGTAYRTEYYYETQNGGKLLETKRSANGVVDYAVQYLYDSVGRLAEERYTTEAFGQYAHTYEYDKSGNLIKANYNFPESPYTMEYSYDASGRLTEKKQVYQYPLPSTTVTKYVYGSDGLIVSGEITNQSYDGSVTVTKQEYEKGLLIKETIHYYDGDVTKVYEYDAYGNLTKVKENVTYEYSYTLYYREASQ